MEKLRIVATTLGVPVLLALGVLGEGNGDAVAAGPKLAKRIAAGSFHTCARLEGDQIKCWGYNLFGTLGLGDTDYRGDQAGEMGSALPTVKLGNGRTALEVVGGYAHTCARLDNAQVKCWGFNSSGQLGLGDRENRGDDDFEMGDFLPLVDLGLGRTAFELAAGAEHTCARLDNGQVKCWGLNLFGTLGLGDTDNRGDDDKEMGDYLPPVDLGKRVAPVVELAAGAYHTCARFEDGQVKCWGDNRIGQIGLGNTLGNLRAIGDQPGEMGDNLPYVDLGTGRRAVELAAGSFHTCARLDNGDLKCWGYNTPGTLGLGHTDVMGDNPNEMGNNLPRVELGDTARALAAGGDHNCAQLYDGRLKCWGGGGYGQVGFGNTDHWGDAPNEMGAKLPALDLGTVRFRLSPMVLQFAAGTAHTCAWLADPLGPESPWLKCWGNNSLGQLGLGDTEHRGDQPNEMGDLLPAVDLGMGSGF